MINPVSTYRIQFHKDFTFADIERALPYLIKLGVKTLYASPIFKAVPGSIHGYDLTDPHLLNPEIGTMEDLLRLSTKLRAAGMNWLQDIVPNHMAFHTDNKWLVDVLEKGPASAYAAYFDIDWEHPVFGGRLMVPILNNSLETTIDAGEIMLVEHAAGYALKYFDTMLPLKRGSPIRNAEAINRDSAALKQLLDEQHYVLCNWRDTDKIINYRRFFTINGLISLNMQEDKVFNDYHSFIKTLCERDVFQGLRVDHVDGLANPTKYLNDLRALVGPDRYIVVEKILAPDEALPVDWPVAGTTGYDFLADVNGLLSNGKGLKKLEKFYDKQIGNATAYDDLLAEKKELILDKHMQGDLDNLCRLFFSLDLADKKSLEHVLTEDVKNVLRHFLVLCPVYAYYGNTLPLPKAEANNIKSIFKKIKTINPDLSLTADIIEDVILTPKKSAEANARAIKFYQRCMQYTGPLMAKGGEDTSMYIYNSFIGHNDVGDAPDAAGYSSSEFHHKMSARRSYWPYALNATATHDTKRGEDARARLNALSDLHEEWVAAVKQWKKMNAGLKQNNVPDDNDEYFIYQALIASQPMPGEQDPAFRERFKAYIQKVLREAKVHSDWAKPNLEYEASVARFIDLLHDRAHEFYDHFCGVYAKIVDAGMLNSLVQLVLKFTCPGLPDTYQGTELWDLSMVDPDNRRPVDYEKRIRLLDEMVERPGTSGIDMLWKERYNGKIKLWLTHELLKLRAEAPKVFSEGSYLPLETSGKYKDHVIAFARIFEQQRYIVVTPLNLAEVASEQNCSLLEIDWQDTAVDLPTTLPMQWTDLITGRASKANNILVRDIFKDIPIAILRAPENDRSAGVLTPLFSLNSNFGIGDLGPGLREFVDFLSRAGQKYWQMLPLTPVNKESAYSPYNSVSSMAGNLLFISPELLAEAGLIKTSMLKDHYLPNKGVVDYAQCKKNKRAICEKAYANFCKPGNEELKSAFKEFCNKEAHWLDDYALYVVLREEFSGTPWNKWPEAYKKRDTTILRKYGQENEDKLTKVKWIQFIVARQWENARRYANSRGIKIFGDLPFYVSYDSADVWAHPEMFCLDDAGNMSGIAGVPPDYFSKTGQLWNMPTYNWAAMKKNHYDWWIRRLRKNLELFDVLRLDHFRAFEAYWQVPAGEKTAVNGEWIKGPGTDFFDTVKRVLGMPFIAEDLGDNMDDVYRLREETRLPGMKVLQFAWGETMPVSVDAPHNYPKNCVVYTGTHDNNTMLGWYEEELKPEDKKRLERYTGLSITKENINDAMMTMAYASVGQVAIIPIQDILRLGAEARINTPGTAKNNWKWRMDTGVLTSANEKCLAELVRRYNRL